MYTIKWGDRITLKKYTGLLLILFFLVLMVFPVHAQEDGNNKEAVDQVMMYYRTGRIDRAELDALRLLNHPQGMTSDDRAELNQVLAFISIARDDPQLGREYFLQALREKPDLHLDRALTSPKILAVFDEARADYKRVQIREQDLSESAMRSINLRLEGAKRSLILPGWGQFYKGNRQHGYVVAGTTLLVGSGLLYSQLMVTDKHDKYHASNDPDEASSLYDEYRDAWTTRNVLGIALGIVWAVNLVDALYYPPAGDTEETSGFDVSLHPETGTPMVGMYLRF